MFIEKSKRHFGHPDNRWFVGGATVLCLFAAALLVAVFIGVAETQVLCESLFSSGKSVSSKSKIQPAAASGGGTDSKSTQLRQLDAIVHYATSRVVPQQTLGEIRVSLDVLKSKFPCNFLVFGLGHDSVMWAALNPGGITLFLEENPKWVQTILKDAPYLEAHTVKYRTMLSQADELLKLYPSKPACWANGSHVRGNEECPLALNMLPEGVYDREWDLIMIDAPRGYFPEAPGRMAAIYTAAVMARNRREGGGGGVTTHVFLHDVDRKVERVYSETFLCRKNLVKSVGRLRHFEIPPTKSSNQTFC